MVSRSESKPKRRNILSGMAMLLLSGCTSVPSLSNLNDGKRQGNNSCGVDNNTNHIWPSFRSDPKNSGKVRFEFSSEVGGSQKISSGNSALCPPAVSSDKIFLTTMTGDVIAYDYFSSKIWEQDIGDTIRTVPALSGSNVIVTAANKTVAFDSESGEQKWKKDFGAFEVHPKCESGVCYVANSNGIVAIKSCSGKMVWKTRIQPKVQGIGIDRNRIYVTSSVEDSGELVALSKHSGEKLSNTNLGTPTQNPPVISEDYVITSGSNGNYKIIGKDGLSVKWSKITPGTSIPAVAHSQLYLPSGRGEIFKVFDLDTGELNWSAEVGQSNSAPIAVSHGVVVPTDDNGTHAFNQDGSHIWNASTKSINSNVALSEKCMYFVDENSSNLYKCCR